MRKENKEKTASKPVATVATYCGFKVIEALHLSAERVRGMWNVDDVMLRFTTR